MCAGYGIKPHEVPASFVNEKGKRVNNVLVDHRDPVVDPVRGFTTWDELVDRLFVEADGLQVLCFECHANKTADERQVRKDSKTND